MFHECDECTGAEYQISRRQRKVFLDNNEFKRDKKKRERERMDMQGNKVSDMSMEN